MNAEETPGAKKYQGFLIKALKGYEWLKENHPETLCHINSKSLNLREASQCVLGQGFRTNYWTALMAIHPNPSTSEYFSSSRWAREHGFFLPIEEERDYDLLTDVWKELLETGLGEEAP